MNRQQRWTTRLDPTLTLPYGVAELHSGWWLPPQWPGRGTTVTLAIPDCGLPARGLC